MNIPSATAIPDDQSIFAAEVWRRGLRSLRQDGIPLPEPMLAIAVELEAKAFDYKRTAPGNAPGGVGEMPPSATIDPMGTDELDTAAVARIQGLKDPRSVAAKCRRGTLPHRMVNGRYLIRREYLEKETA